LALAAARKGTSYCSLGAVENLGQRRKKEHIGIKKSTQLRQGNTKSALKPAVDPFEEALTQSIGKLVECSYNSAREENNQNHVREMISCRNKEWGSFATGAGTPVGRALNRGSLSPKKGEDITSRIEEKPEARIFICGRQNSH